VRRVYGVLKVREVLFRVLEVPFRAPAVLAERPARQVLRALRVQARQPRRRKTVCTSRTIATSTGCSCRSGCGARSTAPRSKRPRSTGSRWTARSIRSDSRSAN